MKYLIVLLTLSLSGCFFQTINSEDIKNADLICKKNNSYTVEISSAFDGREVVTCSNLIDYTISHYNFK